MVGCSDATEPSALVYFTDEALMCEVSSFRASDLSPFAHLQPFDSASIVA